MDLVFPIVGLLGALFLVWALPHVVGFLYRVRWGFTVLRDELAIVAARRNFRGGRQ